MKKFRQIIGIDVGKSTLAVHLYHGGQSNSFKNTDTGIADLLKWVGKTNKVCSDQTLFVVDQTGLYTYKLSVALWEAHIAFAMVSGLSMRRSLGIVRGKSDPIDASNIANYGYIWQEKLVPYSIPSEAILQLKNLLQLRNRMVKQRAGYKSALSEQKRVYDLCDDHMLVQSQKAMIQALSQQIKTIEKQCRKIIRSDQNLDQQYRCITSIKGVGQQTACHVIATTHGFTRFDKWRQLACYCGTAPFPYQSGSSIRGKTKVSHLASKNLKRLFNMCALSAIKHDKEIKAYYQRKIEQGKHKMSVINAVRNKIIARIFAVVNRKKTYVDTFKFAA